MFKQAVPVLACRLVTRLDISNCSRLRDDHLAPLRRALPYLSAFSLENCALVTPAALSCLDPSLPLRSLSFIGNNGQHRPQALTKVSHLSMFSQMTSLRLSDQGIGDGAMGTVADLPQLRYLDISGCMVTQAGADRLTTLSALRSLNMSWTRANHPPALYELRSLCMSHCTLGGGWDLTFALYESQVCPCRTYPRPSSAHQALRPREYLRVSRLLVKR